MKIDAGLHGGIVAVSAAVDRINLDSKDLKLQIILVEKQIRHLGENGIRFHPMVVRAFGGDKQEGYPINTNTKGTFVASFDLEAISGEINNSPTTTRPKAIAVRPSRSAPRNIRSITETSRS